MATFSERLKNNAWIFICLVATLSWGCAKTDPIGGVVEKESANPFFQSGLFTPIVLPGTAPAKALDVNETNLVVLETRKVIIRYGGHIPPSQQDLTNYTAILIDIGTRKEVVLMRYDDDRILPGWWTRIYEVR